MADTLKFLNCKKSALCFLNRGDNSADFKHVGMQPSRRERLTMLVIVGSNRSVHCLMIEDGNGSKTQDFENTVAASSLMSSSFISVKVENLVEDSEYLISNTFGRINRSLLLNKEIFM